MNLDRVLKTPVALFIIAILSSVLISVWVDFHEDVINPDAICYLYSAEYVGIGGLSGAMHLCPQAIWPFYSVLIYALTTILHLSSMIAALFIDTVFSAISVVVFILIAKQLSGSLRVMVFAALTILLAHEFNILRQDIIRDHGFWAFYLISILCLLRYFTVKTFTSALLWSGSLLCATLFRIEGAMFLILLPLLAWFEQGVTIAARLKNYLVLNSMLLLALVALFAYVATHPNQLDQLGRLPEVMHQIQGGITLMLGKYQVTKEAVSHAILTHTSLRDAGVVVVLLMIAWYVVSVVNNLSIIYAILVAYAWCNRQIAFIKPGRLVVLGYLLVNLVITFCFFAENYFLAKRYLIALSLVFMLWVPFALDQLYASTRVKTKIFFWLVMVLMVVSGGSTLFHFGHTKEYVREAGQWLSINVPADAKLYTNDYQLLYYSGHAGNKIFEQYRQFNDIHVISHGHWQDYDYLALMKGSQGEDDVAVVMQEIHLTPVAVFVSSNGSHIYVYKVSHRGN